jgi:DNA-binding Lrp family transcriptional regulator
MTDMMRVQTTDRLDGLLPSAARRYLAHTAKGKPIRELAREAGCHASTVLRQVRKLETMRDDPLVDRALSVIENRSESSGSADAELDALTDALRKLSTPGVILLYNQDLLTPALVRTSPEGEADLIGTVSVEIAAVLILWSWITLDGGNAVKRYRITPEGRLSLPDLVSARDKRASHDMVSALDMFSEPTFDRRSRDRTISNGPGTESPLTALARRRGPDGQPFLTQAFVAAGDRLYEDFAIAGFEPTDPLGWEKPEELDKFFANARALRDTRRADAIERTLQAIKDLGPGLSDVALRCCCLREGLETTEKRMGWSARSGKVVLRIALQRLSLFYADARTAQSCLVG